MDSDEDEKPQNLRQQIHNLAVKVAVMQSEIKQFKLYMALVIASAGVNITITIINGRM